MDKIELANARKKRLAKAELNRSRAITSFELQSKSLKKLHDELEKSYIDLKSDIENIAIKEYEEKFTDINNTLVKVISKLESGINVNNLSDIKQQGDVTVKNLKDITNKVSITNLKDIKFDTKDLAKNKTLAELDRTLANIANQLGQLDEKLEPKQKPENFMPIRRVIKVGNRLEFDDSSWGGSRGGSGGSSTTGGATAANQTDGSQKTQIVDAGGEAATVTGGKLDVNASVDTTGLALAANQQTDALTDTELRATPVPVSGTVTETNSAAIKTAVEAIDNAIAGNEMQVDVVTMPTVTTNPVPTTTGGLSIFRSLDLDESEEQVKATAGQIYSLWFTNRATTTRWLKIYNDTAANVTVGTTTPLMTLGLPGNTTDNISGMFGGAMGWAFDTAITVAATTGVLDNDTGAPATNDVIVNIGYK